tara:strand:- start:1512 stop:2489 length:978 start_codon:yes stop_codon:yes gene_type:complete
MYLVTGAAGFIGFHLCENLLQNKNNQVIGIDNVNNYYSTKIKKDRIKVLKKYKNFKFIKLDLNKNKEFAKIKKYKNRVETIIHLAGQAGVRYSIVNPGSYVQNNIMSYINLLEFFKESSEIKLIIYASSSSIYGEKGSKHSVSSKPQINPISVYSASKLSMELISKAYNYLYQIKFIGVRFFSVYGPWGRPDMFYYKFLDKLKAKKPIEIYNYGNHYRSFTYIDDVVLNLEKIINKFKLKKKKICEVFNIGNPSSIKLNKFISLLEKKLGKKAKKRYIKKHKADLLITKCNVIREKRIFDHSITVDLKSGLDNLIEWYKSYYKWF